jgi:hypothetical protein
VADVKITPGISCAIGALSCRQTMLSLLMRLRGELAEAESAAAHRRNRDPEDTEGRFRVPLTVFSRGRMYTFVFALSDPSPDYLLVEAVSRVPPPAPGEERP